MITPNRIRAFLVVMQQQAPEEWGWQRSKNLQYWHVEYKRSYPPFHFFIEFNDEMLYVQYILRDFRVRFSCWPALYRILLRLNEELTLVKFGLTAQGNITLLGELPAAQFSLDTLQNLLRLMVQYLENLYWEIGVIAESEELAPFLVSGESNLLRFERRRRNLINKVTTEDFTGK
jgi:hypothetical protein